MNHRNPSRTAREDSARVARPPTRLSTLAKCVGLGFATSVSLACLPAHADELADLKAQMQLMSKRLAELEAKANAPAPAPMAQAAPAPPPVPKALTTDQNGVPIDPASTTSVALYTNSNTSLRMYGLLEATLSDVNHQTPTGGRTGGFQTAWFSGNRLGFDAAHALAIGDQYGMPDLKVIAKLESEFELPTGNMDTANVFFNRDAWLGFYSDTFGKVTLGRQNTLTRDFTQSWGDPYGTADVTLKEGGYSNVNNFKQFIFYSAGATGTRLNSAIEWKKRFGDNLVAGLAYGFGSGGSGGSGDVGNGGSTPGDFTRGTTQEASIAYNALPIGPGKLSANASYNRANVAGLIHQSELLGGNYSFGPARINAGYVHYTAEQGVDNTGLKRVDNSWTTSFSLIPSGGKFEYDLGYQVIKGTNAGFNGGGNTLNPFGNTSAVKSYASGSKKSTYGSIIYHVDGQLDVYFAADYFRVTGGWVLGDAEGNGNQFGGSNPYNSEVEAAIGARFKF